MAVGRVQRQVRHIARAVGGNGRIVLNSTESELLLPGWFREKVAESAASAVEAKDAGKIVPWLLRDIAGCGTRVGCAAAAVGVPILGYSGCVPLVELRAAHAGHVR